MSLYPIFADLRGRRVLVVGGGVVAERKVEALLRAEARVRVVAPTFTPVLTSWAEDAMVEAHRRDFAEIDLEGAWLIIAATADAKLNARVATLGESRQIFVNVVDDAALSHFQVPAVIDRSPVIIAVSSGGEAPMLARLLREKLEAWLDPAWGALGALLGRMRSEIRLRHRDLGARRRFYEHVLAGPVLDRLRAGKRDAAKAWIEAALKDVAPATPGEVILVGAGPGDPGLLTLRGLRALNEADVILHDCLVSDEVLALARRDAERISVGKRAGCHRASQEDIHALMIEHARAGRRVVRLKGGDPFVFGRGGEELQALRAQGIPYQVVPGITAALACAAYAGIPLTHRAHASALQLVTAHGRDSVDALDWAALARPGQTLALYMGVAALDRVEHRLITHGLARDTPFALVENGSRDTQRVVVGRLDQLRSRASRHGVRAPALLIVGAVAAHALPLGWFGAPVLADELPVMQSRPSAMVSLAAQA